MVRLPNYPHGHGAPQQASGSEFCEEFNRYRQKNSTLIIATTSGMELAND